MTVTQNSKGEWVVEGFSGAPTFTTNEDAWRFGAFSPLEAAKQGASKQQ
jgi:hypothetical protein